MPDATSQNFTITLSGDCMPTRPLAVHDEPNFLAVGRLFMNAHVGFTNLETVVRLENEGTPGVSRGTHMTTPPPILDDLRAMGITLFSCANNHAFDYGEGGVLATLSHLEARGLVQAGAGRHLAEARGPAYRETRAGRVALVAATATFKPWHVAASQRPDCGGRPGVNPIALETTHRVDAEAFAALGRISEELGLGQTQKRDQLHFFTENEAGGSGPSRLSLLGSSFERHDGFAISTSVEADDLSENLKAIREARRQADWVVVSVHSHEFAHSSMAAAATRADLEEPAEAIGAFARAAIDAGADLVVGHGAHVPLGIEIYKGRPIFYSLGNFIFQNETVTRFPAEAYKRFGLDMEAGPADFLDVRSAGGTKGHGAQQGFWESVVVTCRFEDGAFSHAIVDPIELGFGLSRSRRGRPMIARPAEGERILERVARLSRRYGAEMSIEDGRGIVRP